MSSDEPLLVARRLSKRFGGLVALDELDLEVRRDEILGLIGPNGSGKTTFFNVVTGIYEATDGEVLFAGRPITNASPQAVYRAGIARTFQRSRLSLPLSIFDNIMIGNHKRLDTGSGSTSCAAVPCAASSSRASRRRASWCICSTRRWPIGCSRRWAGCR